MKRKGRPRTIHPKGKVARLTIRVAEPVAKDLEREAKRTGRTIGAVARERLEKAS